MWLLFAIYITIGFALVFFSRVRGVIRESIAEATNEANLPTWKVAVFLIIVHCGAVGFWPFFLRSWFAKPRTAWDTLNENPMFQRQKELFEAMSLMSDDGVDADEMPNGRGEFGMTSSNPIPCKTVFGSTAYLGSLRTLDGSKVVYERVGSVSSDVSTRPVDAYELSHPNGKKLATIFISPYQKRISNKAPKGFKLADISFS